MIKYKISDVKPSLYFQGEDGSTFELDPNNMTIYLSGDVKTNDAAEKFIDYLCVQLGLSRISDDEK